MLKRIREQRYANIGGKPSLESLTLVQRESDAEFDSLCEEVVYAIKEFGLEEQQGYALADSLFDLSMEMFTTGKVSRGMAMSLESISSDLIDERFPINSYTLKPSRTNLSVAMEAAMSGRNILIGGIIGGILLLLVKIFSKLGETGESTGAAGTAIAASGKPLIKAAEAADEMRKIPTVAERINELMKEDVYINQMEKYKRHYSKAMDVLIHNQSSDKYVKALDMVIKTIPIHGHGGLIDLQRAIGTCFDECLKETEEITKDYTKVFNGNPQLIHWQHLITIINPAKFDKTIEAVLDFCRLGGVEISGNVTLASLFSEMAPTVDNPTVRAPDLSHPIFKLSQFTKTAVQNLREEYGKPSDYVDRIYQRHTKPFDAYSELIKDLTAVTEFVGKDVIDAEFNKQSEQMSSYFKKMADNWQKLMGGNNRSQKAMLRIMGASQQGMDRGAASVKMFTGDIAEANPVEQAGVAKHPIGASNLAVNRDGRRLEAANNYIHEVAKDEARGDPDLMGEIKAFEEGSKNVYTVLKNLANELAVVQLQMVKLIYMTNSDAQYLFHSFAVITRLIGQDAKKIDDVDSIKYDETIVEIANRLEMAIKEYDELRPGHILNTD